MRESKIPTDYELIDRYLSGELSEEELGAFQAEIDSNLKLRLEVENLRTKVSESIGVPESYDLESAVRRIHELSRSARGDFKSHPRSIPGVHRPNFNKFYSRKSIWGGIASIAAVVIVVVAGISFMNKQVFMASQMSTYETGYGERATIRLPDGSSVLLSVASRIHVPTDYSQNNRNIILDGQALFTVANNEGAPFTVRAGQSFTKVLGTRFSVRHYNTDSIATVAVESGRVAVGSSVITANEGVNVTSDGEVHYRQINHSDFSFAEGVLKFRYKGLREAIPELNRWYNADVRLGDESLAESKVVGVFEAGSITDLMSILELLLDVKIVRDGRALTLYKRG